VIWHHEGAISQADVVVTLPPATPWYMRHWVWGVGGGALVLIIVLTSALGKRHQPQQKLHTGMLPPEPASPKPVPTPVPVLAEPVVVGGNALEPLSGPRKVAATPYEAARPVRVKTQLMARFPAPSKETPATFLVCEKGFAPGQKFPVTEMEYWIGALETNHLRIADDLTVSGNHACLIFENDVLGIYDYKSTNGTRVNGEVVKEKRHLLRPGDRIQIGRSTFAIQLAEQEGA